MLISSDEQVLLASKHYPLIEQYLNAGRMDGANGEAVFAALEKTAFLNGWQAMQRYCAEKWSVLPMFCRQRTPIRRQPR
jgi:hypothetical protein